MTKKDFMAIVWSVVALALFASVCFAGGLYVRTSLIKRQQTQIDYLNRTIGEYKNTEAWFEDYVDVLEDIYERESEIKVLKERIYWLNKYKESTEFNKDYADQMYDDLETYLSTMINYVEQHGNLDDFNNYFSANYKEVYDRIDNIYDENH